MISATPANRSGLLSYLSLFASFGTWLCCALPSLLVLLGLGATVASFLSAVPWLVTLSHHKNWVFTGLRGTYYVQHRLHLRASPAAKSEHAPWMRPMPAPEQASSATSYFGRPPEFTASE